MIRESDVRVRRVGVEQLRDAEIVIIFHDPDGRLDHTSAQALAGLGVDPAGVGPILRPRVHACSVGPVVGAQRPQRVLTICLDRDPVDAITELRNAGMVAGRHLEDAGAIGIAPPANAAGSPGAIEALVEGLLLGRHRFARAGSGQLQPLELSVVDSGSDDLSAEGTRGRIVADATNWVRQLVTTPPADKTPEALAEEVRAAVGSVGASVRIWTRAELEAAGFRGILAVAAGSAARPVMVEINYQGADADVERIALAGKGVTFDSGGLDLKALESMYTMKSDMGGAAAVAASVYAAGKLSLPTNLRAALPMVENMPGGTALRPGDVIRHWNGVTSEVVSPDAEGRLILADAMAYLASRGARSLVAVSTLTGATAVGADLWGVFSAAPELAAELVDAGTRAGEPGWQLPLWRPYRSYLESEVADLRNQGERLVYSVAGIVASLFLDEFVPQTMPWAHIDIAATVMRNRLTQNDIWPVGATGCPARTLIRWLQATAAAA